MLSRVIPEEGILHRHRSENLKGGTSILLSFHSKTLRKVEII
jgi:hypothetical protein